MEKLSHLLLIIFLFCRLLSHGQSIAPMRHVAVDDTARYFTFGGTNTEEFRDLILTADSGFALVGTTNGYGQGNSSIYLVRTTKTGQHVWSSVLGGANIDIGSALLPLSDGGFLVAGSSNSFGSGGYDGYLSQTDAAGNLIWEKGIGGVDWDFFYDLKFLPDSSIIVCGESYSFSSGGTDAWVLRLDLQGNILWQRNFGGSGNDAFQGLCILDQSIYLAGYYQGIDRDGYLVKLDFSGQLIFEKMINYFGEDRFNAITKTNSAGLFLGGGSIYTDSVNSEFWIQHCDTNGVMGWSAFGNGPEDDYFNAILVKGNADVIATGVKTSSGFGQKSILTFQYDSLGTNYRAHAFGGTLDDEGYGIIETPEGGLAFAATTNSYGSGDFDACLLLLDTNEILADFYYSLSPFYETLSPIGISEEIQNENKISIYPNPVENYLWIRSENKYPYLSIKILSMDGRKLLENFSFNEAENKLDVSMILSGIYFIEILDGTATRITRKFIKK